MTSSPASPEEKSSSPRKVVYARVDSYEDPVLLKEALEKVLAPQFASFGSLEGKKVLFKPNLLVWKNKDEIASVNPAFLLAAVKIFRERGALVTIRENPAVQTAHAVVKSMGIADELEKLGVLTAPFEEYAVPPQNEKMRFHNIEIAKEYCSFDAVLDIAKAKTHGMMTLTLCVKNLFGMIRGSERLGWHLAVGRDFPLFADMLLDLYLAVRPAFNLVDGIVCMEGNGPGSGTSAHRGFVAGSNDALALDSSLSVKLGVRDLLLVRRARERGLLEEYEEVGGELMEDVAPLKLPDPPGLLVEWGVFLPPFLKTFLREYVISRPVLDQKKCIGCGLCAKMCPPRSLKIVDGHPRFHLKTCIRCYCCQEHCPKSAITPKKSFLMKVGAGVEKVLEKFFGK
ncbi:MAG: DUF362 domain-containing protein [Lentisphaeria bacterium]|nr:DUF362 domain-containing protein [Lentisphaeria bacterium]